MLRLSEIPVPFLALLASLFTCLVNAAGAATVFASDRLSDRIVAFLNASAAGIMIAASFFSLLMPAVERGASAILVTVGFLSGGIFLIFSDLLVSRRGKNGKSGLFYTAITLHNLPEGLAIGVALAVAKGESALLSALLFAFGIGVQNFPEGVCVSYTLLRDGCPKRKSFFRSVLSGMAEIPSALLGCVFFSGADAVLPVVLAFSAGAMIFVTCSELLPECFSAHKGVSAFGFLVGFAWMMLLDLSL